MNDETGAALEALERQIAKMMALIELMRTIIEQQAALLNALARSRPGNPAPGLLEGRRDV